MLHRAEPTAPNLTEPRRRLPTAGPGFPPVRRSTGNSISSPNGFSILIAWLSRRSLETDIRIVELVTSQIIMGLGTGFRNWCFGGLRMCGEPAS